MIRLPPFDRHRVRKLRESHALSREDFAVPLFSDEERVKDWENGKHVPKNATWLLILITYDADLRAQWLEWVAQFDS